MLKRILALLIATALLVSCSQPAPSSVTSSSQPEPSSVTSSSQPEISSTAPSSSAVIDNPSTPGLPDSALAVPEPSSTASSSPSSAAPDFASKTWWQKGLAPESFALVLDNPSEPTEGYYYDAAADKLVVTKNVYSHYSRVAYWIYDDTAKLSKGCYSMFNKPDNSDLHNLGRLTDTAQEVESIGARILPNNFFEFVAFDDTKYTGEFYERGVRLTQSLPGGDKGRSVNLAIGEADYRFILAKAEEILASDGFRAAAWLTMMRYSRLASVQVSYGTSEQTTFERDSEGKLSWQVNQLFSTLQGYVSSSVTATTLTTLPDAAVVKLSFNNSLVYTIHINEKQMLVAASGVDSSLLYDHERGSLFNEMTGFAKGEINPVTGKPVIYLYPTQPTDCTVKVDYNSFTYTYPAYNNGWKVTAYPDGRLVNKADNSEHYYLFWEGNKQIDWSFDSGFVVAGSDTERFLREKLAYMGLTPREYNDFITYWVPRLMGEKYNLITFAGEQYEKLAPLTVTPTPDSVLRVHMVFRGIDTPVAIPEQQLERFERKGFTVVEWGGTDAN